MSVFFFSKISRDSSLFLKAAAPLTCHVLSLSPLISLSCENLSQLTYPFWNLSHLIFLFWSSFLLIFLFCPSLETFHWIFRASWKTSLPTCFWTWSAFLRASHPPHQSYHVSFSPRRKQEARPASSHAGLRSFFLSSPRKRQVGRQVSSSAVRFLCPPLPVCSSFSP